MLRIMNCLAVLVAGAAILAAPGCGGSDDQAGSSKSDPAESPGKRLVGEWVAKAGPKTEGDQDFMDMEIELVQTFKEDGTASMDVGLGSAMSGTWEVVRAEGDTLTIKAVWQMQSLHVGGHLEDGVMVETEKVTDEGEEEMEFSVVFESDDRMVMAPTDDASDSLTFERRK